ncbi:hypothetical protein [Flavivirga jejuensis]|uniref:Uncharacterized protein n=1 Tax=Flavivirga jejuensis TaxID=870487 RepID=A0ABT8WW20_9FLAO|nr:hypothetical protein [Flavivirga jejuensis]MDO5977170.1 hypothetical protein [Flavivirga jejuensis]
MNNLKNKKTDLNNFKDFTFKNLKVIIGGGDGVIIDKNKKKTPGRS